MCFIWCMMYSCLQVFLVESHLRIYTILCLMLEMPLYMSLYHFLYSVLYNECLFITMFSLSF